VRVCGVRPWPPGTRTHQFGLQGWRTMVKGGEYDFAILFVCLLILGLQIHNPFQPARQNTCQCAVAGGPKEEPRRATERSSPDLIPAAHAAQRSPPEPAPVYRRPREATAAAARPGGGGGLSTDELLRELDSIQVKAKEQQATLAAAGRMPPASPILDHLRESEASGASTGAVGGPRGPLAATPLGTQGASSRPPQSGGGLAGTGAVVPSDAPLLRRRDDFGRFLEARQPRGLGVVLGVGRGDFALRLLGDWASSQGVYLVDPFIYIWRGYDDPSNLNDREHQMIFEELRNRLAFFEGRYVLVRDFSHSFAETYLRGANTPGLPTFVYVDANHGEQAVSRDLELWWPLLASGGVLAGSTYADDADGRVRVRTSVDRFASRNSLKVYLTHDDMPPSWFVFKS